MNVSSAELREKVSKGESIAEYVPEKVMAYIHAHSLYQEMKR